jgi:hypothetical protein
VMTLTAPARAAKRARKVAAIASAG